MNLSAPFIRRPVATTLLTAGLVLAGLAGFSQLPVSPLPQVDFPTLSVQASLPGASPEIMATSVATPLERALGQIADVAEMSSTSSVGNTRITLQFGLSRDIDGAARDVQAAINAARADLPTALRSNPTYRKVNPADAPVLILALTSETLSLGQVYDSAATVLQQKLSQVKGVGQVAIGGSSLPAVRVQVNPHALFKYGISLENIRAGLSAANAYMPKGAIEADGRRWQLYTNDQTRTADEYRNLVIASRKGAAVRLADVAEIVDSVEDTRHQGLFNGHPAVVIIIYRQPGANIIDTVDRVKTVLPALQASIPAAIDIGVASDRTTTIRASLREVERTLGIAIGLVILVVFLFLRNVRAALVPMVVVPASLIGTFGGMYLLGYSLDNLSLMALTVATGFVVDDAIVVLENISRHAESGMSRMQAALTGAREVGFTVISISLSLIAVFVPILLMGGIVGRLFREFAVTLSIAILVSLVISLTTTPMMCAWILRDRPGEPKETGGGWLIRLYERSLGWSLRHSLLTLLGLGAVIALNVQLYRAVPKGFFPQQDTGMMVGNIQADQGISFQAMRDKLARFLTIVRADPAVQTAAGFTGGFQTNSGFVFVTLKPVTERKETADQVIGRLRGKLAAVPGARLFLQAVQDIRVGGRMSSAQYQYTLQADQLDELYTWAPRLAEALSHRPELADVNSDQQQKGQELQVEIDRLTAARLGLTPGQIDNTLYDAFGQRQVSTIYNPLNQYHVILELAPRFQQNPEALGLLYISTSGGAVSGAQGTNAVAGTVSAPRRPGPTLAAAQDSARNQAANQLGSLRRGSASTGAAIATRVETMVPLTAVTKFIPGSTALSVNHSGPFVSATLSFNLPPGRSLGDALALIGTTLTELGAPAGLHGSFQGAAKVFQDSLSSQPRLILAAIVAVYLVLGILYESLIHPLTILSTLPSAGVGAVLALMACRSEFSIIALIGVLLLIGIVKKNAILMIDFAIDAERRLGLSPREAITRACLLRFRPILMTTLAAAFGALPLALGSGDGAELRQPLGISIVGGLALSQLLTLYTTPVVYLYHDRFRLWCRRRRAALFGVPA